MTQPAYLPQTARQNVDWNLEFSIRYAVGGAPIPIEDWVVTMQVRRAPGEPGDPLIEISNGASTGGDGIAIVVTETVATIIASITWPTLNDDEIPSGRLAYDMVADLPNGDRWGLLYGEFIAKQGVTVP
jgi:hypothetical protein